MNASRHFQARAQQRGFSAAMVDLILGLGDFNEKGDLIVLGRKEIDQAIEEINELRRHLERMRSHGGAGIACSGDTLITTFHRCRKFKRK